MKVKFAAAIRDLRCDLCHRFARGAKVAAMPQHRGKGIGIAEKNPVGGSGGQVFLPAWLPGNGREFIGAPFQLATPEFDFAVGASAFRHLGRLVMLCQRAGQSGGASGFGTDQAHAFAEPGAHRRFQKLPMCKTCGLPGTCILMWGTCLLPDV